jgi:hypothetical protein
MFDIDCHLLDYMSNHVPEIGEILGPVRGLPDNENVDMFLIVNKKISPIISASSTHNSPLTKNKIILEVSFYGCVDPSTNDVKVT